MSAKCSPEAPEYPDPSSEPVRPQADTLFHRDHQNLQNWVSSHHGHLNSVTLISWDNGRQEIPCDENQTGHKGHILDGTSSSSKATVHRAFCCMMFKFYALVPHVARICKLQFVFFLVLSLALWAL